MKDLLHPKSQLVHLVSLKAELTADKPYLLLDSPSNNDLG